MNPSKDNWISLSDIAEACDVPIEEVRLWLQIRDLLDGNKRPSVEAIEGGYAELITDFEGIPDVVSIPHWCWHRRLIDEFAKAHNLRDTPAAKHNLKGPFTTRLNGVVSYEIIGADNKCAVKVVGRANAKFVLGLLNLAHKHR